MELSKKEIIEILKSNDKSIFKTADEVRREYVGDGIHLRGLIEFSNICKRNCLYCGLQSANRSVKRYRLSKNEILTLAKKGAKDGYKTIVLQSGEDDFYTTDLLCDIVSEIKSLGVAITLSIGEKNFEEYKAYKEAGADRFLLRIETTDENLYKKMHPYADFANRRRCLYDLKRLGYETGTGCLVGLPEQSVESLADDILFFKELNADMVGIGPFIPHPQTPLKTQPVGNFELAVKVMALTRVILPDINIPATTAMESLREDGRMFALQSGANVIMPNLTDEFHKKMYEIYPNKVSITGLELENKISQTGRFIVSDSCGFRKNN